MTKAKKPRSQRTLATYADALLFPFQYAGAPPPLGKVFAGWSYDTFAEETRRGPFIVSTIISASASF